MEPRPDMNIKVTAFTESKKFYYFSSKILNICTLKKEHIFAFLIFFLKKELRAKKKIVFFSFVILSLSLTEMLVLIKHTCSQH